ncbi:hypothetical protein TRIUR3_18859 [Triticum urartu]|uniref:Uncharacterized protein n=1 Tax=Triticum urartu TaxID=4572 RepID=M8A489_TRIUA|nr:hypothetical protein TRIUR3_18859 [Triticum urartu]
MPICQLKYVCTVCISPANWLFVVKSKELVQYQVMEGSKDMQESDTEPVVKVPREPAIIINGVPDLPPEFASGSQLAEDLEWHELEEILLPLDITIPLKTLVMDKFKHQNVVPGYRTKVARARTNVASNQVVVRAVNGQQSNNLPLPGLLQASASAGENALVCLKPSDQPKKRGRPRKDRSTSGELSKQGSTSGDIQPKKRGRPPKEPGEKSIDRRKLETVRAEKLKRESMLLRGPPPGSQ